ncbi:uncharacterized protein LOC126598801 isoform X2 [Malus sylvestris]|uniref:uncharacterized protein LOC126598801 isoform X2 n=1 Tax=Malus sylvestris TaxID=3752 RepID=UPI0021AC7661|nr:uncharacterized protein LOC126598801 isoform X2 [Malus sylvestris]
MELGLTWPSIWMYLRMLIHSRTPARQPFLDSTKSVVEPMRGHWAPLIPIGLQFIPLKNNLTPLSLSIFQSCPSLSHTISLATSLRTQSTPDLKEVIIPPINLSCSPGRVLLTRCPSSGREEKVSGLVEEVVKPRKRWSKKEKLDLVLSLPSPCSSSIDDEYRGSLDRIGQLMTDLIMWRNVARSSLWFGLGSLFFLSFCFAKGINFRISQIGLLFLGASFVSNSICQRRAIHDPQGSSVLSYGSKVWASYNILEALYAWYAKLLINQLCCQFLKAIFLPHYLKFLTPLLN